ncbi:MAG: nitronate monooxygenase [Chloroflexota bacterium]|nr:nitronate monooxygenase [Chloroflexota bacterium]
MLKTRVTEMLNIKYPIIQGGMQWLSRAELVAAVSNAGGLGIMTSAQFSSKQELVDEIRKAKQLTDKPFGVNISLFPSIAPLPNDDFVDAVIEEGVAAIESSGFRAPDEYVDKLKKAGVTLIHKVATVRHAKKAESVGADMIGIVGFENGGALGMDDVTTFILVPRAVDELKVPVIAGGGIGDGRGLVAALALGAEGVVMGTAFLTTTESNLHQNFKDWIVNSQETDTVVVMRSITNTHRALKNKVSQQVVEMEQRSASLPELLEVISGQRALKAFEDGDIDGGLGFGGQVVGLLDKVVSTKELVESMVSQAEEIMQKLNLQISKS